MKYYEITIETTEENLEALADALMAAGISSVEIIDPADVADMIAHTDPTEYADPEDFAAALAARPAVRLYLECDVAVGSGAERALTGTKKDAASAGSEHAVAAVPEQVVAAVPEQVVAAVRGAGIDVNETDITVQVVDDADWKDKWKEAFVPTRISDRIWVRPSWTDFVPPSPEDVVIAIDPGIAFGTGTHETTFLTVRLMEKYLRKGCRVLDVGCGTGILSIAASMLGAGEVLGIDIDEEAVRAAEENIGRNGVAHNVRAVRGDLTDRVGAYKADVVVANLLTPLVIALTDQIAEHLADGGVFISSGILDEHTARVVEHLESRDFRVLETLSEGGWCAIAAAN